MDIDAALDWAGRLSCGCSEAEYAWMYETIMDAPDVENATVLEIGSWTGPGTVVMAAACQERGFNMVSLDTWHLGLVEGQGHISVDQGKDQFWLFRNNTQRLIDAGLRPVVTQVVANSQIVGKFLDVSPLVFLWIDAGHGYPAALVEFRDFGEALVRGGVVGFHDAQEKNGAALCIKQLQDAGDLDGYTEVDLPALGTMPPVRPGSTIDHTGPWWTRAWRRG